MTYLSTLCKNTQDFHFDNFIDNYVAFVQKLYTYQPLPQWDMDNLYKNQQMRLWMFQSCTHYGYFQIAPQNGSIRSKYITTEWHMTNICYKMYPELKNKESTESVPRTKDTNVRYASLKPLPRVIYTNGNDDPWSALSIKPHAVDQMISFGDHCNAKAYVISKGSHCNDLYPFSPLDSKSISLAKLAVLKELLMIVKEC